MPSFLHKSGDSDALVKKRGFTDKLLKLVSFSSGETKPSGGENKNAP